MAFLALPWSYSCDHRPPNPGPRYLPRDAEANARAPRGLLFRELPEVRRGKFGPSYLCLLCGLPGVGELQGL